MSIGGTSVYHPEATPPARKYDPVEREPFFNNRAPAVGATLHLQGESLEGFDASSAKRSCTSLRRWRRSRMTASRDGRRH
jgi:hypothetical protein